MLAELGGSERDRRAVLPAAFAAAFDCSCAEPPEPPQPAITTAAATGAAAKNMDFLIEKTDFLIESLLACVMVAVHDGT